MSVYWANASIVCAPSQGRLTLEDIQTIGWNKSHNKKMPCSFFGDNETQLFKTSKLKQNFSGHLR